MRKRDAAGKCELLTIKYVEDLRHWPREFKKVLVSCWPRCKDLVQAANAPVTQSMMQMSQSIPRSQTVTVRDASLTKREKIFFDLTQSRMDDVLEVEDWKMWKQCNLEKEATPSLLWYFGRGFLRIC